MTSPKLDDWGEPMGGDPLGEYEDECDHEWACTGTEYGGDDESYHGEGRCYCVHCGADGDG